MEGTGAKYHDIPRQERGAAGFILERGRCRTPFSPDLPSRLIARSERIDDRRRIEPAFAGSPSRSCHRGCVGAGNSLAVKDDAGTRRRTAPGRAEYFPAPEGDALRFAGSGTRLRA